jgi:hypothetical protein
MKTRLASTLFRIFAGHNVTKPQMYDNVSPWVVPGGVQLVPDEGVMVHARRREGLC